MYCVYVIELDGSVWKYEPRMQEENPDYDPDSGLPCVYVGASSKSPEVRLQEHMSAERYYSRVVRNYSRGLLPDLYDDVDCTPDQEEAALREKELAGSLRQRGYAVWRVADGGLLNLNR